MRTVELIVGAQSFRAIHRSSTTSHVDRNAMVSASSCREAPCLCASLVWIATQPSHWIATAIATAINSFVLLSRALVAVAAAARSPNAFIASGKACRSKRTPDDTSPASSGWFFVTTTPNVGSAEIEGTKQLRPLSGLTRRLEGSTSLPEILQLNEASLGVLAAGRTHCLVREVFTKRNSITMAPPTIRSRPRATYSDSEGTNERGQDRGTCNQVALRLIIHQTSEPGGRNMGPAPASQSIAECPRFG